MGKVSDSDIEFYNKFCKNLTEGCILYNVNKTNSWGEYLLVANITEVILSGMKTYSVLLIGLKKEDGEYLPKNLRIKITPDHYNDVHFLNYVGRCNFNLIPNIKDININKGLIAIYQDVDLRKYAKNIKIRKPKNRKYAADGKLVIRKAENEN